MAATSCTASCVLPVPPSPARSVTVRLGMKPCTIHSRGGTGLSFRVSAVKLGTVSAVAQGSSRSLVERAADVTLKERRKLVLVIRETPLSLIHLRNLTLATEAGAVVLPASPGLYHRPTKVEELVDFVVQRVLDQLGLEIDITRRWGDK